MTSEVVPPHTLLLRLPGLVAGRGLADQLLSALSSSWTGARVVVDATQTSSGSASFASQIVVRVLVEGDAASLTVVGAPSRFTEQFRDAALRLGVGDRLVVAASMHAPAVQDLLTTSP